MTRLEAREEHGAPMLLAGLRRAYDFAGAHAGIALQWRRFQMILPLARQASGCAYGVICDSDPKAGWLEYMCAVEVETFDGLDEGFARLRTPAHRYAVFTHDGHVSDLRRTWERIWSEWIPTTGQKPAHAPDFERYGPAFDPVSGYGDLEIWFPIE